MEKRLPLIDCPEAYGPCDDDLQPFRAMGSTRHLGKPVSRTGLGRTVNGYADD